LVNDNVLIVSIEGIKVVKKNIEPTAFRPENLKYPIDPEMAVKLNGNSLNQ